MTQRRSRLVAAREAAGFSQERLAIELGFSNSTPSRWERGLTAPQPWTRRPLATALGVTLEELDALLVPDSDPDDPSYDDSVNRRDAIMGAVALGAAAALPISLQASPPMGVPSRVGLADVERLRAQALAVKWTERRYGGGAAYRPTQDLVGHVRRVLAESSYDTAVGAQMRTLLAELWQELGWCAYDAGDQNLALGHFNAGLSVATLSGDDQVAVIVLNYMALQASEYGSGDDAVTLAQAALDKAAGFGSDRMLSLLGSRLARAYALAGDKAAAHAAFAEAERRYQPHDPGRDPEWIAFWNTADFQARLAIGHLALGDLRAAESAAEAALHGVDRGRYQRDAASYASWCALALASRGDIDGAAERTVETVGLLDGVASGRIAGRLRPLVPIFKANPAVSAVPEALDALASA